MKPLMFAPPPRRLTFILLLLFLYFNTSGQSASCLAQINFDDIERLPIATIALKFHFREDALGNNFQCDDPNAPYYAPTYAQQIIDAANLAFSDPAPSTYGTSPDLPDARIRYRLAGDPSDPCSAIYIEGSSSTEPFSDDAIHIVIADSDFITVDPNGSCKTGANTNFGISIRLRNIHCNVFQAGWVDIYRYGTLMNHEMGHWFGLCHAYASDNPCGTVDMIPAFECGGAGATVAASGACSLGGNFDDVCNFGNGNNMMGENGVQNGLTLCQWSTMYHNIDNLRPRPAYISFKQECTPPDDKPTPIVISTNTIETWSDFRFIDQPVEIEANATLIISCEVRMAANQPIIVHRGGRLFVSGGKITSQGPDCLWGGIYVSGNAALPQPDPVTARIASATLNANGAGVVWFNSATILNAPTAVTTRGYGDNDLPEYWGGLVMANTTDFIDNSRVAEFMKYDWVNKSYFKNCEFKKVGPTTWLVNRGVSIWACSGIEFTDNFIDGPKDYGIQCWNAVAKISGGYIRNALFGLHCDFSMPNIFLDNNNNPQRLEVNDVDFEGNLRGIYSNATPNLMYPFTISECKFRKLTSAIQEGIRMNGESSFAIGPNNIFENISLTGILANSTGEASKRVFCNEFSQMARAVGAGYNNRGLVITANHFKNAIGYEINVTGSPTSKGSINEEQQASNTIEAGNCFDVPNGAIGAALTSTVKFKYFIDLDGTPDPCKIPSIGANNYTIEDAALVIPMGYCEGFVPSGLITEEDLKEARDLTEQLKAYWEAHPEDEAAKSAYLHAAAQQALFLDILLKSAGEAKDFDKMEDLLLGEKTNKALRDAVGLRTALKDYTRAEELLDSMPILAQDDQWFKEIMAVNFDMFKAPGIYELTPSQEDTLMTIANSPHSLMCGYACALLSICKGYECVTDTAKLEERSYLPISIPEAIKLYPNPVSGMLNIECPDWINETIYLDVFDLSGRTVRSAQFHNTGLFALDCSQIQQGAYFLRLHKGDGVVHHLKVHILH